MPRRLLNRLILVSRLLCWAVAILWICSYVLTFAFGWVLPRQSGHQRYLSIWFAAGVVQLEVSLSSVRQPESYGWATERWPQWPEAGPAWDVGLTRELILRPPRLGFATFKFDSLRGASAIEQGKVRMTHRFWQAIVPGWLPVAVLAAAPLARQIVDARRRRRARSARCARCGYDLRATPDRCPECGAIPVQTAA